VVLMVAILDPPREEAVEAIKIAHKAGITVKMITGTPVAVVRPPAFSHMCRHCTFGLVAVIF
jgi:cation transport ATPase